MYHQIKPTETFRERHIALLEEAENRRLAWRLRAGRVMKARSTVAVSTLGLLTALLAAGLLALFAFSLPALGKQNADTQQSALVSDNKDALVAIESSAVKASFASGSGANFLGVKVSDHGNLLSFESPQGQEAAFEEGYALCSNSGSTVHGHDTEAVEGGFGTPRFSQPTAGAFPLTVTRKTTDGKFQLKQVWAKPDATEKDVTVTMTLKNISGATINGVVLSRSGDFDVGTSSSDQGARTADSAWQWDDVSSSADASQVGLTLTALTFGTNHGTLVEPRLEWRDFTRPVCIPGSGRATPTSAEDLAMRVFYNLGNFNAGQSKSAKFEYGRM